MLRIGMLGCGNMAAKMADALAGHEDIMITGVAARERSKAKSFASKHCPDAKVYTTYAKLAAADDIDLIYIATPNTYHYEHAIMCIKEYKNILVEKPFAMSRAEADSIFFEAKNRNLFVAEAMWTSFMPLHAQMLEWVNDGRIGQIKYISANLGYDITDVPRLNDPVLGGGAYLDLGCYTTNLALSLMGDDIKVSRVFARKYSTGIDKDTTYCLETDDGSALAVLYVTMTANTDKNADIVGESGRIHVTNINNYRMIELYDEEDELVETAEAEGPLFEGYAIEVLACADAISKGLVQAPEMPWSKSAKIAQINDIVRSMM
ncbi:MAG: Gfo/Idh/MocA family oxidoreductase [Clostridiales bacterium]|nr:Gfo/Idh/MocA family oxidoreductase [Clostridiales bacterium]MBR6488120.1 Gfo/Idh/MocA family oxidoreductase [Clostridiales bacterium]